MTKKTKILLGAVVVMLVSFFIGTQLEDIFFQIFSFILFGALLIYFATSLDSQKKDNESSNTTSYKSSLEIEKEDFIEEHQLKLTATFELKGFHFTEGKELIENYEIVEDTYLTLKTEANNAYDENAVAVFYKKKQIGYVDKENSKKINTIVSMGFNVCFVKDIKPYHGKDNGKKYLYVHISIPYNLK